MNIRYVLLFTIFLMGCSGESNRSKPYSVSEVKETLTNVNKGLVDMDRERIEAYIIRHQLDSMQENGAGLFYLVWGDSTGRQVKTGDIVLLDYKVTLLDGTLCYTSGDEGYKEFLVGQGGVESGLEMGVLLMSEGQRAKFILPPHLGHGLLGDREKIPPRSTIVFDIHLISIID